MTQERKDEIVRKVIYSNISKLDIDNVNAFNVGRIIGFIHKDLERELSKEVEQLEQLKEQKQWT